MDEPARLLQAAYLLVFTALLAACAVTTTYRAIDLYRRGIGIPLLLVRDVLVFTLLAVPFLAILAARAARINHLVADDIGWVVMTSTPAVLALAVFLVFEFAVIGRRS